MSDNEQQNKSHTDGVSAETIEKKLAAIRDDPYSDIVSYSDIFVALAQLRSRRSLEKLDYVRMHSRGNTVSENIKAVEDSLNAIRSLYEMALEQTINSYEARIERIISETETKD